MKAFNQAYSCSKTSFLALAERWLHPADQLDYLILFNKETVHRGSFSQLLMVVQLGP